MLSRVITLVLVAAAVSATASAQDSLKPGETFRDCAECPEMVVIPAGSFTMGVAPGEEAREEVPEKTRGRAEPRHRVTIGESFGLGKYEVTRGEFAAFVRDSGQRGSEGCSYYKRSGKWKKDSSRSWRDPGFSQTDNHPVTCVSWDDAKAYVGWLARKTGKDYHLPSESGWEYAARAGTTTARYWGEDADRACGYGNVYDRTSKSKNKYGWEHHDCRDGYVKTAPVGSFRANDFGLHDVLGNVWEWVEDCYQANYDLAPRDGSAWTKGCMGRVLRGGAWAAGPTGLRAAVRISDDTVQRINLVGFRIAWTLP